MKVSREAGKQDPSLPERWVALELGYDEIKTELLDREEAIRSRTPTGVQQEPWGIFLAYNLVRLEMESATSGGGARLPRPAPSRSTCGSSAPRSRR